jgi:hypothetical protein
LDAAGEEKFSELGFWERRGWKKTDRQHGAEKNGVRGAERAGSA